MNLVKGQRLLN